MTTKQNNFILISGRPASGKTQLLIAYANMYPQTTLVLSEENSREDLHQRNLSKDIKVINSELFQNVDISKYKTICIDYIELFSDTFIKEKINPLIDTGIRIIILQQMDRKGRIRNNPFGE